MRRHMLIALTAVVLLPAPAGAWGFEAHKLIMDRAIDMLPAPMRPFFDANRVFLVEHVIDPDLWRTAGFTDEPPRHFLDMDAYGAYPFTALPREYGAALEKYGIDTLNRNGLLPWRTAEMAGRLRRAFEDQQRQGAYALNDIKFFSSIIGHYVADAHPPLHAVLNYDGQLTGQHGLHYRWEGDLFVRYEKHLSIQPPPLKTVVMPRDFIFETLLEGSQLAKAVLDADREATGNATVYDDRYFDAFFAKMKPMVERRLNGSISAVASVIATAWEQAGRPALPINPARPPQRRRASRQQD